MMKSILFTVFTLLLTTSLQAQTLEQIKDIDPGSSSSYPQHMVAFGNKLYFSAADSLGNELWVTDGTETGTLMFKDINPGSGHANPRSFILYNNLLYFIASEDGYIWKPWVSDATEAGTLRLKDINVPNDTLSYIEYNGKLYFQASDGTHGYELWVSDGSAAGTVLLKDIHAGSENSRPDGFIVYSNQLFFSASDSAHGRELWVSDGTDTGTRILKDIDTGIGGSNPAELTEYKGKLYFSANDGTHGYELWVSDGTDTGTRMLKDMVTGSGGSFPSEFTEYKGKLYFKADNGTHGNELWVTDGTESGTTLLKDINPSGGSNPAEFFEYKGKLYFAADDGTHGREVWVTDGTEAGTLMLKDIDPGSNDGTSFTFDFTEYNGRFYFVANTSTSSGGDGYQLWVSDGTEAGTVRIPSNTSPIVDALPVNMHPMKVFDGSLYFVANYDGNGYELWKLTDVPLPVTWLSFDATATAAHTASLNWKTAAEKDNSHFEVERSYDGKSFKAIGKVPSAGNTDGTTEYHFVDDQISRDVVYYRIKQVDIDGRFTYSTIAQVAFQAAVSVNNLTIAPNPGQGCISLQIADFSNQESIKVTDINGRLVFHASVSGSAVNIPAAPGMYVVSLLDKAGAVIESQKAIVE